jgi:glycerophosphoryl diester phosphodiesterase
MMSASTPQAERTPQERRARLSGQSASQPIWLIHHAANRGEAHPPGSLQGLQHCLEQAARIVELDITPLLGGGFALLHGPLLDGQTTGSGPVAGLTAAQVRELHYVWQGRVTDTPVGLLAQALELIARHAQPVELQLDLKPHSPLTESVLRELVDALQPCKDRARVTSPADWGIRRLRELDPELPLGFDPVLYLEEAESGGHSPDIPPLRQGAYGYWDEHPLASRRWGTAADYLAARAEALWVQAPRDAIWYISAYLLAQASDDGFDWIGYLHARGAEVAAWTLDADRPADAALARRLAAQGVDRIVTNDAPALARALDQPVLY